MAMVAGSVTVAIDGTYTGTGFAKALMDGEVAVLDALASLYPHAAPSTANRVIALEFMKTKVEAQAAALVAAVAAADVRIPAGSIDTGIPSTDRVLAGALE